jgi:molybdopterin-guanine dinucleotide biosynthesis protein A
MGVDKAALRFGPETMLERVLRLVTEVSDTIVLAAAADQRVPEACRVTRDPADDEGPLPGLLRAAALLTTEQVFVVACDTPLLQPSVVTLLSGLAQEWDGAVPVIEGRRVPTCAVYRRAALLGGRQDFGDPRRRSLQSYVSRLRIRDVGEETLRTADPDLRSFVPCNTPREYRAALRLAGLDVNSPSAPAV